MQLKRRVQVLLQLGRTVLLQHGSPQGPLSIDERKAVPGPKAQHPGEVALLLTGQRNLRSQTLRCDQQPAQLPGHRR